MKQNIFGMVKDLDRLAMELRAKIDNGEESNEVCEFGTVSRKSGLLKRNKVYSEADLQRFTDDNERRESTITRSPY